MSFGHIDAVIFDFGGVILDLNYDATDQALKAMFPESAEIRYSKAAQTALFDAFETGELSPEEFRARLREAAAQDVSDEAIDRAWNAMLLDVPPARIEFLRQVAQRYRTFLFSNTNAIHKTAFDRILARHLGEAPFDGLFEKAYYSHTFGLRKPHVATYEALLKDAGLTASRTLFIDDNKDNIAGARAAGLQVYHLTGDLLQAPELHSLVR